MLSALSLAQIESSRLHLSPALGSQHWSHSDESPVRCADGHCLLYAIASTATDTNVSALITVNATTTAYLFANIDANVFANATATASVFIVTIAPLPLFLPIPPPPFPQVLWPLQPQFLPLSLPLFC
jgi:hypothetical protein